MVYFGKYRDGRIIPEPGLRLAEGAIVRIVPVDESPSAPGDQQPDPADDLSRFAVPTGIPDLASQHDHYCSGAPKDKE